MPAPKKYDAETQERAIRMYRDRLDEHGGPKLAARRHVVSCSASRRRRCGTGSSGTKPPRLALRLESRTRRRDSLSFDEKSPNYAGLMRY